MIFHRPLLLFIVVPTLLRAKLLHIAHAIPAAGHLGVAKTKARLQRHFYWPGISRDVKEFCRTRYRSFLSRFVKLQLTLLVLCHRVKTVGTDSF